LRVLVTGALGQVGSWVLERKPPEARATGLDRRGDPPLDIRSPEARARAGQADVAIHLAALIDVASSMADPAETFSVNVEGTRNLLRGMPRGSRFVFVSSAAVYGDAGEGAVREDHPAEPISPYGRSKLDAEAAVRDLAADRGLAWVVVRPFNIYSSRQDLASPYAGVITAFMRAAFLGKPLRIDGDGLQTRDFVHAGDVADFLWLAARSPDAVGGTFNVATGTSITVLDLAAAVQRVCGVTRPLQPAPPRPGDIRYSRADVGRALALGWRPRTSLEQGLAETASGLRRRLAGGA
jgi:UDP-glucose 4-epimerase